MQQARPEPRRALELPAARPSLLARWRDRDHTTGSILGSIAVLSLPSTLTSVAGFGLFQLVDLRFLGQLGPAAVAAAGATNQTARQLFFMFVFGVSVGAQMMIARLAGAGNVEAAEHVAGQTFVVGLGLSIVCALVGGVRPDLLVSLISQDPEVIALGSIYLRITFLTMAATIFVQLFSHCMKIEIRHIFFMVKSLFANFTLCNQHLRLYVNNFIMSHRGWEQVTGFIMHHIFNCKFWNLEFSIFSFFLVWGFIIHIRFDGP